MRRKWVVLLALAAAIAVPVAVWAAVAVTSGVYSGNLDAQRAKFRNTAITTTSTTWHNLSPLSVGICAINEVSATLSVNLSGGRARFRILGEQGNVIQPGPAEFAPSGIESFSYTFVTSVGTFEADDKHTLQVQWRSTTGAAVSLRRADLNVLYERGSLCT
ncbi:MAG TPA: hypothetical protein VGJ34_05175 [Gaiellaceae bacterium]|jgi:hypothetical protein